ncbi:hypothetical protein NDR89_23230 [Cupriavidus gilardii]|uniref:Replicative helicase inhibitor G39P N-terminal domain-containing protein n=1 Tax=Cupriavidus gilardii TaxID=82541 RepID=A0ABY4VQR2_9BURK|nr:hypothetical protein [Cupriavidus gilardii]USE79507.1 hypothetical protein NDR89_23230 [Cupriavidus gilardii]
MKPDNKQEFSQVIRAMFDNYGRQMPLPETLRVWWAMFESFSIEQFRMACLAHMRDEPKFPPSAAQLLERMSPAGAGRPGPEEAWAIAVKASNESETVVMIDEIAQAWGAAAAIFALGDEVGARMAFKEVYERLTKGAVCPPKWWPSIGNDPYKRDAALADAKRAGLLPGPSVAALLPGAGNSTSPEGLARLKEEMKRLTMKVGAGQEHVEKDRMQTAERKKAIADAVALYEAGGNK